MTDDVLTDAEIDVALAQVDATYQALSPAERQRLRASIRAAIEIAEQMVKINEEAAQA